MWGTGKSNKWMLSLIHKTMTSCASAMPKRALSKLIVPIFDPLTEVRRHHPCLLVVAVSNSPVSLWLEILGKRSRALCLANHEQLPLVCACGIAAQGRCYALLACGGAWSRSLPRHRMDNMQPRCYKSVGDL
jgi:hypothetical protein